MEYLHFNENLRQLKTSQSQRFFGLYYLLLRFIPNMDDISYPLTDLLQLPISEFHIAPKAVKVMDQPKTAPSKATILSYPLPEPKLVLMADTSSHAVGAVLHQRNDHTWKPLSSQRNSYPLKTVWMRTIDHHSCYPPFLTYTRGTRLHTLHWPQTTDLCPTEVIRQVFSSKDNSTGLYPSAHHRYSSLRRRIERHCRCPFQNKGELHNHDIKHFITADRQSRSKNLLIKTISLP